MRRHRGRWRAVVFPAVLLGHAIVIFVVLRVDRERVFIDGERENSALELIRILTPVIRPAPRPDAHAPAPVPEAPGTAPPEIVPPSEAQTQPPPPPVDWAEAAHRAAQNAATDTERRRRYNDFSGLTPAQRDWIARNEFVPVAPGIAWKPNRVEVTPEGLPLIHVGDHCIVVPMLAFLMFCKVGHINANSHLFDHFRDPAPR